MSELLAPTAALQRLQHLDPEYAKALAKAPKRPPPGLAFGFHLSNEGLDAKAKEIYGEPNSTVQRVHRRFFVVLCMRRLCPKWPINDRFVWWKGEIYNSICFHRLPPPDEIIDQTKALLAKEGLIEDRSVARWYKLALE